MYANESSIVSNLMMKFSNVPSFASSATVTTTESTSQPTPVFSASSSTSQRAAEEQRRHRKLKRQEKTKHHSSQKPQVISTPEVIPLDDEYESKKQKRLLRNRQAAQQSRERKKQKISQLEEEMGRVMEENSSLRDRVQQLEALLKGNSIFTSPSPETSAASVSTSGQLSFDSCSQDEVLQYDELNTPVTESPSSPGFLDQESPENHDVSSFTPLASSDECLWPSDFFVQSPQETLQYLQNLQNLPQQQHLQRDQQQNLQCLLEDEQQQRQFGTTQQEQQIEEEQGAQAFSSESAALSSFSLPMEEAQVLSTIQSTPVLQVICFLISLSWIQLSVLQFAAEQTNGSSSVVAEQQDPQEEQTPSQSESQSTSVSSSTDETLASVSRRPKSRWKLAQQQQSALDCGRGSFNLALPVLVNTLSVC